MWSVECQGGMRRRERKEREGIYEYVSEELQCTIKYHHLTKYLPSTIFPTKMYCCLIKPYRK